jgi:hypothetical protein
VEEVDVHPYEDGPAAVPPLLTFCRRHIDLQRVTSSLCSAAR